MGCDIHAAIEYKEDGIWKAVMMANRWYDPEHPDEEPMLTARMDLGRDYNMFAILAGVRNGRGFAGVETGDMYEPIAPDRGLPEDISTEAMETACTGDHSDTWVGLQELLDYEWQKPAVSCGLVTARVFEEWDRMRKWQARPKEWCGGAGGPGVRNVSNGEMREYVKGARQENGRVVTKELDDRLYTWVSWTRTCAEEGTQIWTNILPEMLRLGKEHGYGNVRMVMNFDS